MSCGMFGTMKKRVHPRSSFYLFFFKILISNFFFVFIGNYLKKNNTIKFNRPPIMNEIERMSIYQKLIREVFPYLKNEMIPECILWEVLSCHQHITMDIIDNYSDKP